MDVKTHWNLTLELLEHPYQLHEFMWEWHKNPKYCDYQPLFTTQDEWTLVMYVMGVLRPFRYWTLWMSKRHTVTLHHVTAVYNDMFNHMDGVIRALAEKKIQWKEVLYLAVKFAWQKQSKYYTEVTSTIGMLLILAHTLDPFCKLRSFWKSNKGMDINLEEETSYTTRYHEAILKYVKNENCTNRRGLPVTKPDRIPNNILVSSAMASRFGRSYYDPCDLSSDGEEYSMPNNVAETTLGPSQYAACLVTAARRYLDSPLELPQNWGKSIRILMITTATEWRLIAHFVHQIWPAGGGSRKQCTQSTLISPVQQAIYSLSYLLVSVWRAVFHLGEMWSVGGGLEPQARPSVKRLS